MEERIEKKVRDAVTARILREANVDAQVAAAITVIATPDSTALASGFKQLFEATPDAEWRNYIETVATELAGAGDDREGEP